MKNIHNSNIKYPVVIHPFGDVWAVWFKKSRSFLLMEEPAFEVLQFVIDGKNISSIRKSFRSKYSHSELFMGNTRN